MSKEPQVQIDEFPFPGETPTASLVNAPQSPQEAITAPQRAVTPMTLVEMAVDQNADVDKLAKLLDLHMRWEANEAKKAYVSAMKAFKSEVPQILKNRTVAFNQTSYSYATLDNACEQLIPALAKHGLIHKWRTQQNDGKIRVTCVMTHEQGHSEDESWLEALPDTSGSKNAIQAIGSAVSYLERYTLLAACGVAVKGQDTDAIPQMETLQAHLDRIVGSENMTQLDRAFKDAFKEATAAKNTQAMLAIVTAKDKKKAELARAE